MGFIREFKEFAVKGNMIDIAVGVIIGTAFNKVIDVLVKEIFMPPLSMLTGGTHWESKKIVLKAGSSENGVLISEEIAVGYGSLIGACLDFLIIGLTVFVIVKLMNSLKRKAQDTSDLSVATPKDIELLTEISETLKSQTAILQHRNRQEKNDP